MIYGIQFWCLHQIEGIHGCSYQDLESVQEMVLIPLNLLLSNYKFGVSHIYIGYVDTEILNCVGKASSKVVCICTMIFQVNTFQIKVPSKMATLDALISSCSMKAYFLQYHYLCYGTPSPSSPYPLQANTHTSQITLFTTTDFCLTFSYKQLLREQTLFRSALAFLLLSAQ